MADTNETVHVPPERDLDATDARPDAVQPAPPPAEQVADTDRRARKRSSGLLVVVVVLILLAAVIATAFVLVANRRISIADMRTLLELILGPLFTLAGAAVGFYFASR